MCPLLRKSSKIVELKSYKTVHHSIYLFITYHLQQTDIKKFHRSKIYSENLKIFWISVFNFKRHLPQLKHVEFFNTGFKSVKWFEKIIYTKIKKFYRAAFFIWILVNLAFQCKSFAANRLKKCFAVQKIYAKN